MSGINQVSDDFVNELKILACFDPANMSLGIKLRSDMSVLENVALGAHMRKRCVHRRQRHSIRLGKRHVPLERDAPRLLRFVRTPRNTRVRQRPILRHTLGVRTHESGARHAPPPVPEEEGHDDDDGSVEGGPWASRLGYKQTRPLRRAVVVIRYVCVRRFAVVAWSLGRGVVLWRR